MSLREWGRILVFCTCLTLTVSFGVQPVEARDRTDAQVVSFHIPSGRLIDALQAISRQADIQIVTSISPDLRITRSFRCRCTVQQMLAGITQGLPVHITRMTSGFAVSPAPASASSPVARLVSAPVAVPEISDLPITVIGYRESLRQAAAVKHAAKTLVEITRAEDIAAFPDHNAADALQRLPGVTISRDNGEGRQVSLRGLGPLFTRTTLNGMEALATTASGFDNRGAAARQRRFDYSVFDASLFSQVAVQKSWAADRDAGGVGGTVALRTMRPFDLPGDATLVAGQARTSGNSEGFTPQVVVELSRRNARWGVLATVSYSHNRVTEYGYRNWDWVPVVFGADNIGPDVADAERARLLGEGAPVYMARAQTYSTWSNRFDRLNMAASIQHEADSGFKLAVDLLHARLSNHREEYSLAAAGTNGLTGDVTGTQRLRSATISGDTLVTAALSGVDMRTEHKRTEDHTDFDQAVLSLEYPLGRDTLLTARAGYARSDFDEPVFDKVFLESSGRDFIFTATGSHPRNIYGFDTSAPSSWELMRADTREDSIVNENATVRLELSHRLSPGFELRAGSAYRFFGNDGYERRARVDYEQNPAAPDAVLSLFDGPSFAPYIVGDVRRTFLATGQNRVLTGADDIPGGDYRIAERTSALFALVAFEGTAGSLPVQAEFGLQYQYVRTHSTGKASDDLNQITVSQTSSNGTVLPSFEARLELHRNLLLRLAASRNVSQPDVADLRTAAEVNATPFGGTITTGNPALRPFTADALDLSLEHYSDRDGYVSLGLFYKHLDSFITSETSLMAYADTGYPLAFLYPGQDGASLYNVIRPVNGKGATIFGIEAAVQQDLRFLPAPLDRLGVQVNATFVSGDSDVTYNGEAVDLPLIDLSRWSGNATVYYSGRRWDARLAAAYRGTYRSGLGNNGNLGEWIKSSVTLDFAAHVSLAACVKAVFEARNLTNAPVIQYTGQEARRLLAKTRSGRVFSVGMRFRF
ncbi:TonB-dependent receptor [Altericroceibacterium spongiae]|uniref:TonB-dependent receptor n=1 Tax=Altericroceibacterium spongiae TaxID=2320269 RepID=A0A420EKA7_9SPHN|nr:TonB-dependent receptor [Altericroceibacterium spongiae]RKF21162.1 TonB-dependent receptor [Altericroceibacterium spongiae]